MTESPSERNKWLALYVLCAGVLMIVLDVTVVNVALPSVQKDLGYTQTGLAWVINAYLIAFGGSLLLAGRLGDLIGRRRVYLFGLVLFTIASTACGLSTSDEMLNAARFVQGIGGAAASAVILGMIVTMFTSASDQAKAIGVYAFVASAGGAIGLLVGGALTNAIDWRWAFFVNLPVGIVALLLTRKLVEHEVGIGIKKGADILGALLITSALMIGVYTIVSPAASRGWTDNRTLSLGIASLVLLSLFFVWERFARTPLMPLRVFVQRNIAIANTVQILATPAMFGQFFLGALYLRNVLHYGPLETGLAFLPETMIMGLLSVKYTESIITRFGARSALILGLTIVAIGLALFARLPVDGDFVRDLLPAMILLGVGAGVSFPSLMSAAMTGVDGQDAGLASGLINTTAQVGGALGLAVFATLSDTRTASLVSDGSAKAAALVGGYHLAFWISVGLILASAVVVAIFLPASTTPAKQEQN